MRPGVYPPWDAGDDVGVEHRADHKVGPAVDIECCGAGIADRAHAQDHAGVGDGEMLDQLDKDRVRQVAAVRKLDHLGPTGGAGGDA